MSEQNNITGNFSSFPIRQLTSADIPAIEQFFADMGGESRSFFNRNDGNRVYIINCLSRSVQPGTEIFFAAFCPDGSIAGMVFAIDLDTGVPAVGIAVHEKLKGMHLGRTLLQYMDEYAISNGYTGLYLTTAVANMRGQGLYERMGYKKMGTHVSGEFFYLKRFPKKI